MGSSCCVRPQSEKELGSEKSYTRTFNTFKLIDMQKPQQRIVIENNVQIKISEESIEDDLQLKQMDLRGNASPKIKNLNKRFLDMLE